MSNLDISYYEYFKHWIKYLTSEDIGALMIVVPFALGMLIFLVIFVIQQAFIALGVILLVLWFGTAIYLLTKNS